MKPTHLLCVLALGLTMMTGRLLSAVVICPLLWEGLEADMSLGSGRARAHFPMRPWGMVPELSRHPLPLLESQMSTLPRTGALLG